MSRVRVLGDDGPALDLVEGDGSARAILWPGVGAHLRAMHRIVLQPGACTREQRHPGEAVYTVLCGGGVVFDGGGEGQSLRAGSMFHIDAGTAYVVVAGAAGVELLGGPAPVDTDLYNGLGG
jgi:quercetin dioxygenase-like cupin family protein